MRRTPNSDRIELPASPTRPAPTGSDLLAVAAVALLLPALLWVVSYPTTAALLGLGALTGGAVVVAAAALARRRARRATVCIPYTGVCVRL
jgi:hypothetical protein